MCLICDGYTHDEVLALQAAKLDIEQFYVQLVGDADAPREDTWAYTVGLIDAADHPELIVAGTDLALGWRLLTSLGRAAIDGSRFAVGDQVQLGDDPGAIAAVAAVDPVQYELDTFTMWHNLGGYGALKFGPLEAVQIVAPPHWDDVGAQPDLSDPSVRLRSSPDRAQRRARDRHRPRRRRDTP